MKKASVILFSIISFCALAQTQAADKFSPLAELEIVNSFSQDFAAWDLENILLSNTALNFSSDVFTARSKETALGEFANFKFEGAYIFSNESVETFNIADAILSEIGRGIGISDGRENPPLFYNADNGDNVYFSTFSFLSVHSLADGTGFQIFYMPADHPQLGMAYPKLNMQEFIADDESEADEQTDALISDCLSSDKKDKNSSDDSRLNIVIFTKALNYYSGAYPSSSLSALSIQSSTMTFENGANLEIEITENFYGAGNIIGSVDGLGNIVLDIYYDNRKPVSIGFYEYKSPSFKLSHPRHTAPHTMTIAMSDSRDASAAEDEKYIENLDIAASPFFMAIQNPAGNIIFKHLNNLQNLNAEQDIGGFSIWITPYYNYALGRNYLNVKTLDNKAISRLRTQYSIESPGFALGADFLLGNGVIVGANAMLDMPQYFSLEQSYNDASLIRGALYGSIQTGLDIMLFVGAGNWDFSQRRNGISEYKAKYGAKQYEAGLGFSKAFNLSDKTRMRPFIDYEYISLSIDDYVEESKASYVIIYDNRETRTHQARFGLFTDFNAAGSVSFTMGAYYRGLYGDRSSASKISFAEDPYQDKIVIEHKLLQDSFGGEAILTISLGEDMNIVLDYTLLLNPQQENHKAQAMWTIKF